MSEIQSISDRASYVRKENYLSIVISAAANRKKAAIISVILGLWLIGGATVVWNYFGLTDPKTKIVVIVWIAFWLYFSYIMGKGLLWQWSGKEIIQVRDGKLFYKKDTGGRGWVMNYQSDQVKNLKEYAKKSTGWIERFGGDYWSTDCDSLSFQYEDKEIAFGYKLTERESDKIQKLLKKEMQHSKVQRSKMEE